MYYQPVTIASSVRLDAIRRVGKALADPTRSAILLTLLDGARYPADLVEELGITKQGVSNHLACLRWCGFIEARREGRTVYNRIADSRVAEMLELAESLLADNAEHVAACCVIEGSRA